MTCTNHGTDEMTSMLAGGKAFTADHNRHAESEKWGDWRMLSDQSTGGQGVDQGCIHT